MGLNWEHQAHLRKSYEIPSKIAYKITNATENRNVFSNVCYTHPIFYQVNMVRLSECCVILKDYFRNDANQMKKSQSEGESKKKMMEKW